MLIIYYAHFDLDDAEMVREARSTAEASLPAADAAVLTHGGVASLRVQLSTSQDEAGLALQTLGRLREKTPFALVIAESVLFSGEEEQQLLQLFGARFGEPLVAGTSFGRLYCCTRPERELRPFLLLSAEPSEEFRSEVFPRLDLALQRLETQAALGGEEVSRVSRGRRDGDDAIGRILHENVVARSEDPARVSRMHSEVQQLTSIYGRLATDSVMLQEALDRLADLRRAALEAVRALGGDGEALEEYVASAADDGRRNLEGEQRFLGASLDKAKTAIDVVRTHVELDRSEQNLKLSERTLALQVAAGFLEYVLVFYYVEHSWEPLAGTHVFELIPAWIRFGLIALFSGVVVLATHQLAEVLRERDRRRVAAVAVLLAVLLLLVAAMFAVSVAFG